MGTLYENILHLCEIRGIKGGKMCVDLGFSKSFMSDLKVGRKGDITMSTAKKVADYFGVSVGSLIQEEISDEYLESISKHDHMIRYDKLSGQSKFHIDTLIDLSAAHPDRAETVLYDAVLAFGDTNWTAENEKSPSLSTEAVSLAADYDVLDLWGQRSVRGLTDNELSRVRDEDIDEQGKIIQFRPRVKNIPLLGTSFAAGSGETETGMPWTDYAVSEDSPADFAIRINGDSMEPYLHDGDIALCKRRNPKEGEIAAMLIDGDFLVKQILFDFSGALILFSLNRDREDMDRRIPKDDIERQIMCFGTVIMDKEIPLPKV